MISIALLFIKIVVLPLTTGFAWHDVAVAPVRFSDVDTKYSFQIPLDVQETTQAAFVWASTNVTPTGIVQATTLSSSAQLVTDGASKPPDLTLMVRKLTNGNYAPEPPGPLLVVGEVVTWTYFITNTGSTRLRIDAVVDSDDMVGAMVGDDCAPQVESILESEAVMVCTNHTEAVKAGQYINTVTVTATSVGNPLQHIVVTDESHYFGEAAGRPDIALTKYTDGQVVANPTALYLRQGDPVTWTYRITNTGTVRLGNLALTDDRQGAVTSCTPALADGLAHGASAECTASGVVQAGQYTNTATVTGETTLGTQQAVQATAASYYFGVSTDTEVSKQVAPASADAGEVVTYTLIVTGPAAAQPVTLALTDTLPAALQAEASSVVATLGAATLDPATHTLHWSYTTTAGRADTATITYRARLTTQCTAALTNRARLSVNGVEVGQAAATLALKSALQCELYLPVVLKPVAIEPAPALVNGNFDQGRVAWSESINNVAGRLIFRNGETPYTAQSPEWFTWLGGAPNEETKVRQNLTTALPTRYPIYVQFAYLLESAESDCARDRAEVRVGKSGEAPQKVWELGLCGANKTDGAWRVVAPVNLSLEALKGQVVTVEFAATLDGARNSNFLVDTVSLCTTTDGIPGIAKCPTGVQTAPSALLPTDSLPDPALVARDAASDRATEGSK